MCGIFGFIRQPGRGGFGAAGAVAKSRSAADRAARPAAARGVGPGRPLLREPAGGAAGSGAGRSRRHRPRAGAPGRMLHLEGAVRWLAEADQGFNQFNTCGIH